MDIARFEAGGVTKLALAATYGVSDVMIGVIVRGLHPNTNEALVWKGGEEGWAR